MLETIGTILFGVVVGWITYRTLRRSTEGAVVSHIASTIAAIGGGAVTSLFETQALFSLYSIGLAIGFFGYLILGHTWGKDSDWMIKGAG